MKSFKGKSKCTTGVTTLLRQAFSASIYTSSLSRTVIVVHIYRCFAVWCRGKETNIAARTDFIDELLQLKSLQMWRNKTAGILKSLLEKISSESVSKTSYRQDLQAILSNRLLLLFFRDQNHTYIHTYIVKIGAIFPIFKGNFRNVYQTFVFPFFRKTFRFPPKKTLPEIWDNMAAARA